METISIPLSKRKLVLMTAGSWVLLALCGWNILAHDVPANGLLDRMFSGIGFLFFGCCGVFAAWKLFDKQPGLIIDSEGIVDNSSSIAVGRIPWAEITGFGISKVFGVKLITIRVTTPEKYIGVRGFVRAWINSMNMKMTGSPINISEGILETNFDGLLNLLTDAGTRFKTPANRFKDTSKCVADVDSEAK
jgi:hypothetical protein